jgi:hypothetical protein
MFTEAAMVLRNFSSHLFYSFVITFYYGSGSGTVTGTPTNCDSGSSKAEKLWVTVPVVIILQC